VIGQCSPIPAHAYAGGFCARIAYITEAQMGSVAACMQGYLIRQLLQPQPRRLKMKKITLMLAFVVVRE